MRVTGNTISLGCLTDSLTEAIFVPNKNKQQIVVINNKKKDNKKKPKPSMQKKQPSRVPRNIGTPSIAISYFNALCNPFAEKSFGCRIPDGFSTPTSTAHQRMRTVLQNDTNGNISAVYIGHPYWSAIFPVASPRGANSLTMVNKAGETTDIYGGITPAGLSNIYGDYRVVANGMSLTNLQPQLSAQGTLTVTRVPMNKTFYSYAMLSTLKPLPSVVLNKLCGISSETTTNYVPLSVRNLPGSREYTMAELSRSRIYCANKPTSQEFQDFRCVDGQDLYDGTHVTGDSFLVLDSSGAPVTGSTSTTDDVMTGGWTCILIRGEGFPTGTAVNCLQLDSIIHLEGRDKIQTSDGSLFIPSDVKPRNPPNVIPQVMAKIAGMTSSTAVNLVTAAATHGLHAAGRYGLAALMA